MKQLDLAVILTDIENASGKVEDVATGIIQFIRENDVKDIDHLNEVLADAFAKKNWSQRQGRPPAGSTEVAAPRAVKLYVSTLRTGYRYGFDVQSFETMRALRDAVATETEARRPSPASQVRLAALKGVKLTSESEFNGAVWHDGPLLFIRLPDERKEALETAIQKVINKFMKELPKVEDEPEEEQYQEEGEGEEMQEAS